MRRMDLSTGRTPVIGPLDTSLGTVKARRLGKTSASIGPDSISEVSSRLIPEEPMFIILNLGMSPSFQAADFHSLQFPSAMYVDYVRLYQREGLQNALTCDPPSYPTAAYINSHLNAYSNPNITTWAQAGYAFPLNKMTNTCS